MLLVRPSYRPVCLLWCNVKWLLESSAECAAASDLHSSHLHINNDSTYERDIKQILYHFSASRKCSRASKIFFSIIAAMFTIEHILLP